MIQARGSSRAGAEAVAGRLFGAVASGVSDVDMALAEEMESTIREDAGRLSETNVARAVDGPSQRWLMVCALTLAAYRALKPLVGDSQPVLEMLGNALARPFKADIKEYIADRFEVSQDAPADAFDRISQHFAKRGEERFGQAFSYVQEVRDETRSFAGLREPAAARLPPLVVRSCHSCARPLQRRAGRRDLTTHRSDVQEAWYSKPSSRFGMNGRLFVGGLRLANGLDDKALTFKSRCVSLKRTVNAGQFQLEAGVLTAP